MVGALGRAQRLTGLKLHAVAFASNHYHLLASPDDPEQLVCFMRYIQSNIAREAGALYEWRERFWSRRYRDIPVSDEVDAQLDRLRYCLAHGIKEGLVARCRDWPGVSSLAALLDGKPLEGVWYDRTGLYEARRRGEVKCLDDFSTIERVELTPIPCWQNLDADEIHERLTQMVSDIERKHHASRVETGSGVTGARAVLRRDPHARPARSKRAPAPRFHAKTREAWLALRESVQIFAEEFRAATDLLNAGDPEPRFPPGSFPPNLPYVPLLAPG